MNQSKQLVQILKSEGLRIIDKRGLPAENKDMQYKAWVDQILLDQMRDSFEGYDLSPEELEEVEMKFKRQYGIGLEESNRLLDKEELEWESDIYGQRGFGNEF